MEILRKTPHPTNINNRFVPFSDVYTVGDSEPVGRELQIQKSIRSRVRSNNRRYKIGKIFDI